MVIFGIQNITLFWTITTAFKNGWLCSHSAAPHHNSSSNPPTLLRPLSVDPLPRSLPNARSSSLALRFTLFHVKFPPSKFLRPLRYWARPEASAGVPPNPDDDSMNGRDGSTESDDSVDGTRGRLRRAWLLDPNTVLELCVGERYIRSSFDEGIM